MKIQKGQVQYKDRNDYYVTYGLTDDGKQYYFIEKDVEVLKNGNRIATTVLVEAIDEMVKPEHIGVVNEAGEEVISCTHRRVKPISDEILLAEAATPISQNVIDAINTRNYPTAATTLVSTTTTVKDKLNTKMNGNGRFVFNDLFSEATIYDINGNNLVNGEYYSFIGTDNNKLYLSKNTVDSEITEYSVLPPEVQANVSEGVNNEIDINQVEVPENTVENALNTTASTEETQLDTVEEVNNAANQTGSFENTTNNEINAATEEGIQMPTSEEMQAVDAIAPEVPVANAEELPVEQNLPEEVVSEENDLELPTISEDEVAPEEVAASTDEIVEDVTVAEEQPNEIELPVTDTPIDLENPQEETASEEVSEEEIPQAEVEDVADNDTTDEMDQELELNLPEEEIDTDLEDSAVQVDSIEKEEDYTDLIEESVKDPDIAEGTKIISGLIKQNKELKNTVASLEEELDRQKSTTKSIAEKAKMQEQKIEVLTEGRKKDRNKIISLENSKKELEEKVSYLERINSSQADEIDMLKPQLEGKEELVKLYAEAESLLDDHDDFDIDDYSFSRRAA